MKRSRLVRGCAVFVLGLLVPSVLARAEPPAPEDRSRPGPEARQIAEALFAEGGTLFQQWQFAQAEEKYREALTHWEHPAIFLYLGRALEKQGHLEQAYAMVLEARRAGPVQLLPEDRQTAEELQKELESRLAQISVQCDQADAEILLDGQPWFRGPGRQRRITRPGQHLLVARKEGYFTVTEVVALVPGKQTEIQIHMSEDKLRSERRWQRRTPWFIAGAGLGVSVFGGQFILRAKGDYDRFREALVRCERKGTCAQISTRERDSSVKREMFGTGFLIVGSAILAAGLTGVLLNQPRFHRSEPANRVDIEVTPLISGNTAGISAEIRF